MIKANELRLGNYFQTNIIQQVGIEHLEFLLNDKLNHSVMKPIPLTEEWLVKLGFKSDYNQKWSKNYTPLGEYFIQSIYFNDGKLATEIYDDWGSFYHIGSKIKHVHQLQNLYFALTGEELTTN